MTQQTPRAVLFDVDGTLVDSNDAHALAWTQALGAYGFDESFDTLRAMIGKGGDKILPELAKVEKDSELGLAIGAERALRFTKDHLPHLRAFDGARELLAELRRRGYPLVIATSAKEDEMRALLAIVGAEDLLTAKTSGDDVQRSKPDPDIVQVAIGKSGYRPGECVMVGDTPYDVTAARSAGARAIASRCGGWDDDALSNAVEIYDGPRDLLNRLDASILGAR